MVLRSFFLKLSWLCFLVRLRTRLLKKSLSQISPEIENVITKQAGGGEKNGQKAIFTLSDDQYLRPGQFYNEANHDDLSRTKMFHRCFLSPSFQVRIFMIVKVIVIFFRSKSVTPSVSPAQVQPSQPDIISLDHGRIKE